MENLAMIPCADFWRGKRVLLTGHTGFKGAWLALWLQRLGAHVTGVSLPAATTPALYTLAGVEQGMAESHLCDIRDARALADVVRGARPEIVLHLAAQALVRPGYIAPVDTFATNVMGSVHLLEAVRTSGGVRVAVVVTTDKVYRNREWAYPYREEDALGGHDPYSASKAAAELVVASYRQAFMADLGVAVATARAGNVIGGGDWAADRLLPDAVRAWEAGQPLMIRRPQATRPWQHVLEPLAAYLCLAQVLWHDGALAGAYNFGPSPQDAASVRAVVEIARSTYPSAAVSYGDETSGPHEAGLLALETALARECLGIVPRWQLKASILRTMRWYKALSTGACARALCDADIEAFMATDAISYP
ncbi:CDP-glucose 4,6-dehydratase [Delftia sp. WSY_14]|uniref:CDP-glucose 4,6-dehydratase n=1 Tax=unclassified Delftia TaxID=2613839 RepID=UPI00370B86F3